MAGICYFSFNCYLHSKKKFTQLVSLKNWIEGSKKTHLSKTQLFTPGWTKCCVLWHWDPKLFDVSSYGLRGQDLFIPRILSLKKTRNTFSVPLISSFGKKTFIICVAQYLFIALNLLVSNPKTEKLDYFWKILMLSRKCGYFLCYRFVLT